MRTAICAIAASALLFLPAAAPAQVPTPDPAVYAPNYGELITRDALLRQSLTPAGSAERKRARRATRAQLRRLRYDPSPTVTAALRPLLFEKFTDGMDATCCAALIEQIRGLVDADTFLNAFRRDLARLGAERNNLADALAVGAVVLHLAYHLEPGDGTGVDERGVRRYVREVGQRMAKRRSLRRISDAEKQRRAEKMGSIAEQALTFQRAWLAEIEADPARAAVLDPWVERNRDLIREFLIDQLDFDPEFYKLTKRGFVRR